MFARGIKWILIAASSAAALASLLYVLHAVIVDSLVVPHYDPPVGIVPAWRVDPCSFVIKGTVKNEFGQPVESASVGLALVNSSSVRPVVSAQTDAEGKFLLIDSGPQACFGASRYLVVTSDSTLPFTRPEPVIHGERIDVALRGLFVY